MIQAAADLSPNQKRELLGELLLNKVRRQFPTLAEKAYLNYGAQGLMPEPALEAIRDFYDAVAVQGPFSLESGFFLHEKVTDTRELIAGELGVAPETISLVENTSTGSNIALWGLDWRAGDHLILSDHEYPGVVAAVEQVRRRFDLKVTRWSLDMHTPERLLEDLSSHLRSNTRLLVLSHIPWDTGQVLPIREIAALCHERGRTRLLVDGAQSVGVLPLDLNALGVDYYAFPGHKWWCGPEGAGGLYVSPDAFGELSPTFAGPRGLVLDEGGNVRGFHQDGRRFEVSSSSFALYAGLMASITIHRQWGTSRRRYERIRDMSKMLYRGLLALASRIPSLELPQTKVPEAGLVFFRTRENARLARLLEARGVLVRAIPTTDCLRASVHYLSHTGDINRLLFQ